MKKESYKHKNDTDLRKKAEKKLKHDAIDIKRLSETEVRKLAHELQVYQIELDIQNEELRKSQQALENSRDRYSRLYDFAPVGYLIISEKGLILEANLTFALTLGMERDSLIKKPLSKFIVREDQDILYFHHKQVLKTKKLEMCELRMMKKDGTHFYAQLESEIVMDHNDHQCRVIVSDITERKEMEEALLQSEKLKSLGIMTAGIAHEFNNILAVMMGSAELLEGGADDNELEKGLRVIIKAGGNGAEIVKNMLKFAQSETKDTSDYLFFDIRRLIKDAIDFAMPRWKNMAQAKGIDYQIDQDGMRVTPEVFCNPTALREVFTNIINNALDAMPDGGTITVATRCVRSEELGVESKKENASELRTQNSELKGDFVEITFADTGNGMPEDVKNKIFDPFFTTRRPLGTGLGLSVSYSSIVRHGGKIEVESEEGRGTTFNLSLPIRKDAVQKSVPHEPDRRLATRKLYILVIDDNDDVCEIMDSVLARGGHAVKTVDNGAEAIELAGEEDFDLVLCDLLMPNIHGYDVIKAINKLGKMTKIGIMTGWDEELKPIDDEDFKVDFILKKPFKHS